MGHPIDPGDPTNGGCFVCVQYLPEFLHATYQVKDADQYTGFIQRQLLAPTVWSGFVKNELGDPKLCQLQYCVDITGLAAVAFTGRQGTLVPSAHCNTPFTGESPQGDRFRFTLEQPPP